MVSHGHGQLYDKVYDCIVSYGEVLSTRIVADYLQLAGNDAHWLDMRKLLRTDSTFREANVVIRDSQQLLLNAIADEPHNIYVLHKSS
jgi:aspartate kinase